LVLALLVFEILLICLCERPSEVASRIQESLSAGDRPDWKDDTAVGIWYAAAICLGIGIALLGTWTWWSRKLAVVKAPSAESYPNAPRWFLIGLLCAVGIAGGLRWELSGKSLWWDELWNVKQATHGVERTSSKHPDEIRFYPTSWARAAWYYQKPTNHAPVALASKASLGVWHKFSDAPEGAFSDRAVRMPQFLSSLASVVLLGFLALRFGGPHAGLAAALALALHPYHVRYGIDARGFSFVVLVTLISYYALLGLWRHGASRWSWLLLHGLCQFLLMWSFPSGVWYVAAYGLCACLLVTKRSPEQRLLSIGRVVVAQCLAAICFLHAWMPNLLQAKRWLEVIDDPHWVTGPRLFEALAQHAYGMPWTKDTVVGGEHLCGLVDTLWGSMTLAALALALPVIAALAGAVILARRIGTGGWIPLATLAALPPYLIATSVLEHHFYHRYLIHLLPAVLLWASVFGASLCARCSDRCRTISFGVCLLLFALICLPQLKVLRTYPYAPHRDVAERLASLAGDDPESIIAAGYGLGGRITAVYNPHLRFVENSATALTQLSQEAKQSGKPLYIFYGYPSFNRTVVPEAFPLLDDPEQFELIETFRGIVPDFTFQLLRKR